MVDMLDDNLAIQIMKDCVKKKFIFSEKASKLIPNYKEIYNSNVEISDQMAKDIVTNVSQVINKEVLIRVGPLDLKLFLN